MKNQGIAIAAVALLGTGSALPAQWKVDPRTTLVASFEDNYTLATMSANKQSVSTGIVDASTLFSGHWPTANFAIEPRVRASMTSGNVDQNTVDPFLFMRWDSTGPKSQTAINARYKSETLFRQYLTTTAINFDLGGQSTTGDLRAIVGRNRQNLLNLDPSASFQLTERVRLGLNAYLVDSSYEHRTSDYINYRNIYESASLGFALTQRSTLSVSGTASQFSPEAGTNSHTYGLQTQWSHDSSAIQRYYLRAGAERTTFGASALPGAVNNATTVSGGAGISWVWQITGLFLDATRNVYPSSTGAVTQQTELRATLQRQFSPYLTGFMSAHGVKYGVVGVTTAADGSRTLVSNIGLEWRITRAVSLFGTLNNISQRLSVQSANASSNAVHLTLVYEPHRGAQTAEITVQH
jgi:hypothetical protein